MTELNTSEHDNILTDHLLVDEAGSRKISKISGMQLQQQTRSRANVNEESAEARFMEDDREFVI